MRLAADAPHQFGGIALDRGKPLTFRLDGRLIEGFAGDTVLSAVLAAGIDTYGRLGEIPLGLGEAFAPAVATKGGPPLPMDRTPALEGLDLVTLGRRSRVPWGRARSLARVLPPASDAPWQQGTSEATLTADVLIVGGGVAGLAAAEAASAAGQSVLLVERRPWLGGDARYFGATGDEETPEAASTRLIAAVTGSANVTVLLRAEAFAVHGDSVLVQQVVGDDAPQSRIVTATARRLLLATGAAQRLPVFAGNRLPRITPAIAAYHLAKRYGVAPGKLVLVATQSNYTYRLALRLHDAGVAIRRVVDTRINPQSRFVDFAKASGLTLGSGQIPLSATFRARHGLSVSFANAGTESVALSLEADALIVSGRFQPRLDLWMLAGGGARWSADHLAAEGRLDHVALAGSVAGWRSLKGCIASGADGIALLFERTRVPVEDQEIDANFETPDAPTPIAPVALGVSFLDSGASLSRRPAVALKARPIAGGHALSLGDVGASVELGLIAGADAGPIAEERGAPGADLVASPWKPVPAEPPAAAPFLAGRFGHEPARVHLFVDGERRFAPGALVYAGGQARDPGAAIGVIVESADPGGIAQMLPEARTETDRFVVETLDGPSPARVKVS